MIIFDIKRFAVHDGPGIRTTVFLKGCPLGCWWCHNPESQSSEPVTVEVARKLNGVSIPGSKTYGEKISEGDLMDVLLRDRHYYEESGGGITFSGGEPMMQTDALEKLLRACKKNGLHTAVDTSGFAGREMFDRVMEHTDLFLYDLKNMDNGLHLKHTGVENQLILSNADYLLENGAKLIFRIPVIPGINTSEEEISLFVSFLEERSLQLEEVHLLPYHRIAANKYARLGMQQLNPEVKEPDQEFLEGLAARFEKTGLVISLGG
ncbi:MAG: glycyl-radical enzyme activating protein [Bacteroidota bacterium]